MESSEDFVGVARLSSRGYSEEVAPQLEAKFPEKEKLFFDKIDWDSQKINCDSDNKKIDCNKINSFSFFFKKKYIF